VGSADVQVVWFKRDLRTRDHAPLCAAAAAGPVLPLYICEPEMWKLPDADASHWQFIADSLADLSTSLSKLGAPLIVRSGEAVAVFKELHQHVSIGRIWAYEETGNLWTYQRDKAVLAWARSNRVTMTEVPRDFVVRRLTNRDDWGAIQRQRMSEQILPVPTTLTPVSPPVRSEIIPGVTQLGMAMNSRCGQQPGGEVFARKTLASFLDDRCIGYEKRMSSPVTAVDSCSRLSSHLTYGTISLREVIARTQRTAGQNPAKRFSLKAFAERLHWRSHFIQKLESQPNLETHSYIKEFDRLRAHPNGAASNSAIAADRFAAFTTGKTGYPMIDACIRSLNETGWINFRMRAMLVSFASYDLWIDWRATAHYLATRFIDYEPGIHYPQIQMQSGTTGINTIRIYDPVKQGVDHDPTGDFIRYWVPELGSADGGSVHEPWKLADTLMGKPPGYPEPIVNHADAVATAWTTIDKIKKQAQRDGRAAAIVEQHGSRRPAIQQRKRNLPKQ
jgi:deoxyribodipyrimidine photo-lyase